MKWNFKGNLSEKFPEQIFSIVQEGIKNKNEDFLNKLLCLNLTVHLFSKNFDKNY
jgi:hypothetical protein